MPSDDRAHIGAVKHAYSYGRGRLRERLPRSPRVTAVYAPSPAPASANWLRVPGTWTLAAGCARRRPIRHSGLRGSDIHSDRRACSLVFFGLRRPRNIGRALPRKVRTIPDVGTNLTVSDSTLQRPSASSARPRQSMHRPSCPSGWRGASSGSALFRVVRNREQGTVARPPGVAASPFLAHRTPPPSVGAAGLQLSVHATHGLSNEGRDLAGRDRPVRSGENGGDHRIDRRRRSFGRGSVRQGRRRHPRVPALAARPQAGTRLPAVEPVNRCLARLAADRPCLQPKLKRNRCLSYTIAIDACC